MTAVHKSLKDFVHHFPSHHLPSKMVQETGDTLQVPEFKSSVLNNLKYLYVKDFDYIEFPKHTPGHLGKKTKTTRTLKPSNVTSNQLLQRVLSRFAYLLRPSSDNSDYVIDMTSLHKLQLRSRYKSLGCVIHVTKDLKNASVTGVKDVSPTIINDVALLALAIYTLLKTLVGGIYTDITSNLSFMTRLQKIGSTLLSAIPDTIAVLEDVGNVVQATTTTQKTLFPFQVGTPQFLDRIEHALLSFRGLLYHIAGAEYHSMISYIKEGVDEFKLLPIDAELDVLLPLRQIGREYWNNIMTFLEDCKEKQLLIDSEIIQLVGNLNLPKSWTALESLCYILWQQTFYHTLLIKSAQEIWTDIGVYLTKEEEVAHEGIEKIIEAFENMYKLHSTSLIASGEIVASPCLSRKFISLKQLIKNNNNGTWKAFDFLSPENVSITLV